TDEPQPLRFLLRSRAVVHALHASADAHVHADQPAPRRARSVASSTTSTPSSFALSSLLPASVPATTKLVFFDTEPDTLPPASRIICFARSRSSVGNVPVRTIVFPARGAAASTRRTAAGNT